MGIYKPSKSDSEVQNRIKIIKNQLYGKENSKSDFTFKSPTQHNSSIQTVGQNYLKSELLRILLLATIAIVAQVLYFLKISKHLF